MKTAIAVISIFGYMLTFTLIGACAILFSDFTKNPDLSLVFISMTIISNFICLSYVIYWFSGVGNKQ